MAAPGPEGLHVSNLAAVLWGEPREKLCSEDSVERREGRSVGWTCTYKSAHYSGGSQST